MPTVSLSGRERKEEQLVWSWHLSIVDLLLKDTLHKTQSSCGMETIQVLIKLMIEKAFERLAILYIICDCILD